MACPIHGGDNSTACTLFEGKHGKPNWRCWTHSCHDKYGKGLIGFVRGVLSSSYDRDVGLNEAAKFLGENVIIPKYQPPNFTSRLIRIMTVEAGKIVKRVDRDYIRQNLIVPSPYFVNRGYDPETLDRFDVGDCYQPGKMMHERAVVPVYDIDYMYAGCAGRTIVEDENKWKYSFAKGYFLYNLDKAKDHISKSGVVNIVEGMGDVWKLFTLEYPNTIAIMGTAFTDQQLVLLERSGALLLNILTDMDSAGRKAAETIISKCGKRFNYLATPYNGKDPGECADSEIFRIARKN